jgi:3-dehydrotetronate 4-kinase
VADRRPDRAVSDSRPIVLGCVADDLTGATDLSGRLVREGMRVVQLLGVPVDVDVPPDVDAVVIALRTRTGSPEDAVQASLASLRWLQAAGCGRNYFKYASTFDSGVSGNIGPVAAALREATGASVVTVCPAFPENRRTVYLGHLFVGDLLLSDSGMRFHPLNPMTDSSVPRLLAAQTSGRVALVPYSTVAAGATAIRERLDALRAGAPDFAVVDALHDGHLAALASACVDDPLCTGGSAFAGALAARLRERGDFRPAPPTIPPRPSGFSAVLAGSCSEATRAQVAEMAGRSASFPLDGAMIATSPDIVSEAISWARPRLSRGNVLIYSTADPAAVRRSRDLLGPDAGGVIEGVLARIARGLVDEGVRRLVVAGGETSGAVAEALGVEALLVGPEIEAGVPVTYSLPGQELALVFKSGNFGSPAFLSRALEHLL